MGPKTSGFAHSPVYAPRFLFLYRLFSELCHHRMMWRTLTVPRCRSSWRSPTSVCSCWNDSLVPVRETSWMQSLSILDTMQSMISLLRAAASVTAMLTSAYLLMASDLSRTLARSTWYVKQVLAQEESPETVWVLLPWVCACIVLLSSSDDSLLQCHGHPRMCLLTCFFFFFKSSIFEL